MRDDDPRRVGHRLSVGRARLRRSPRVEGGQFYGTVGHCECDPSGVRFAVGRAPSVGGLPDVRAAHERHIEAVEGPALPPLTRAQRDALLSYSSMARKLLSGQGTTLAVLERLGLVRWERAGTSALSGWVPTERGMRAIELLRRPRAA